MIGIIGAMPQEVEAIRNIMDNIETTNLFNVEFIKGMINNQEIILCLSGVGKVNASISTTIMISQFNPKYIINIGTAGGLNETQNTLDIVISNKIIQYDFDTSYLDGEEGLGLIFDSDKDLYKRSLKAFKNIKMDSKLYYGDIISGDTFVGEQEKILDLKAKYPLAIACEMEAGAIAQVCNRLNIPFIIIRSLSDIVMKDNSNLDFKKNVEISSNRCAQMIKNLIY